MHAVEPSPRLNFWRVIYGNFLDVAVIDWCKLFGSDHEEHQPVHWKSVVPVERHDEFRAGLLDAIGITQAEWEKYWRKMKAYRDKQAAHFNAEYIRPENDPHYPEFDLALEAVYYYYQWILGDMQNREVRHTYPKDIRDYCQRFFEQANEAANNAINATANMQEAVR